jgi:hypothetical protein
LNLTAGQQILERLILRSLWGMLHNFTPEAIADEVKQLERLLGIGNQLKLALSIDRVQELYFSFLQSHILPVCIDLLQRHSQEQRGIQHQFYLKDSATAIHSAGLQQLLQLGPMLLVDTRDWLAQLSAVD